MTKIKNDRVFPKALYRLLQDATTSTTSTTKSIVSWNADGRSFKIHDRAKFLDILALYGMKQSQYKSFVRQLNLWGFSCIHGGKKNAERGSYYHECFLRDDPSRIEDMTRVKVKGKTVRRRPKSPEAPSSAIPLNSVIYEAPKVETTTIKSIYNTVTTTTNTNTNAFDVAFFEYLDGRQWAVAPDELEDLEKGDWLLGVNADIDDSQYLLLDDEWHV